jgi:protein-S-isoprenylcysteine O-methyltransferase Ste14
MGANMQVVYKMVFRGSVLGFVGIRLIFGLIAYRSGLSFNFTDKEIEKQPDGKTSLWVIFIILGILGFLVYFFLSPIESNIFIILLPDWIHITGVLFCVISLILQISIHKILQDGWYDAKVNHLGKIIITTGPYKYMRHPLYASVILFLIGSALVTAYIPLIIMAMISIPFFDREAKTEEEDMRRELAKEYDQYCKHTGRLLPRINFPTSRG